jgi:hypothetical protein
MFQKFSSPKREAQSPPVFLKTKGKLLEENEEKFKEECTFQPKINTHKSLSSTSREEMFNKLAKSRAEVVLEREKAKRLIEDRETSKSSKTRSVCSRESKVEDRLYSRENKALKYEMLKRKKEEEEIKAFPFAPQVSESVSKLTDNRKFQKPLYLRVKQVQEERALLKQIEKQKEDLKNIYTFHPSISPNSKIMARENSRGSLISRLSQTSSISKCQSFNSSVSINTQPSHQSTDFLNRQQEHLEKHNNEKKLLLSASMENFNFRPSISENSKILINCKRSPESFKDKIIRITSGDILKNKEIKEKLTRDVYGKLKFSPDINSLSKDLAKSSKGFNDDHRKSTQKEKATAKVAEIEKICSFSPNLQKNKKFDEVKSRYAQNEEIMKGIETSRKEKMEAVKRVKHALEVRNSEKCTFRPKRMNRIFSDGDVKVKGVDRFYELRSMAFKQKEELEEREKRVLYKDQIREMLYSPN